ncbi:MAG TPA: hypothetical protein VL025_17255, partial [Thermoanaerobaculia bacterium]|nr:hypothetical protein [Thermoanaerobaculia bacterium]
MRFMIAGMVPDDFGLGSPPATQTGSGPYVRRRSPMTEQIRDPELDRLVRELNRQNVPAEDEL